MMNVEVVNQEWVKKKIKECEGKHVQQVAYSSYHDALTQICFGCGVIRTSMNEKDIQFGLCVLDESGGKNDG